VVLVISTPAPVAIGALSFGGNYVTASSVVRKRGVFVNSGLSLLHHVDVITARCFAALLQPRSCSIRCHVSVPKISLMTSLILTRFDYCNSVLFGLPDVLVYRLLSIQNAAACVIFNLRWTAHVTDALVCLHWLQVPERIRFKVAVLALYRSLQLGTSPLYRWTFTHTSAIAARPNQRSASRLQLVAPRCRLSCFGDRAFPVWGATVWNELPTDITSTLLTSVFSAPA
jgi:hypothetical protein